MFNKLIPLGGFTRLRRLHKPKDSNLHNQFWGLACYHCTRLAGDRAALFAQPIYL